MRVYIAGTSVTLAALGRTGIAGSPPLTAFAVTPGLREHYVDNDIEELEYAAMLEAARASLRMVGTDPAAASRRVVIAADVPDELVLFRDDLDIGVVRISAEVPIGWCAAIHADDAEAAPTIAIAAPLVDAADLGDANAEAAVDDADGHELCWYATQEISELLAELESASPT